MPAAVKIHPPVDVALSRDYGDLKSTYTARDGVFTANRTVTLHERELPEARRADYIAFARVLRNDAGQRVSLDATALSSAAAAPDAAVKELTDRAYAAIRAGDSAAAIPLLQKAVATDSKNQREKLLSALRETSFVMVIDSSSGKRYVSIPGNVYIATDRLKHLFKGVANVLIVDDTYACLRGESMRELLEACGALRCPRPVDSPHELKPTERLALREAAGPVVLVSNEVGMGLVPDTPLGRRFRDAAGRINQDVAALADRVVFVAAGLPLVLKEG